MMKKAGLALVVASFCFVAFMSGQQRYKECGQQRYKEYILNTPQGKVWVNEEIGTPSVGVSVDDLLNMVFHADEIPGFYCVGTRARLNLGGFLTRLEREWFHEDHKVRGKAPPFYFVDVDLKVYPDIERAKKVFYAETESGPATYGSFSGIPIGEECSHFVLSGGGTLFRVGRVVAYVRTILKDSSVKDDAYFAEALCVGLEYLLQHHPKVGVVPSKVRLLLAGQPDGEVVFLKDVAVGSCGLLKGAGVQIKEQRDSKEWSVQLVKNDRWVKVKAFSWGMETDKGKVKLERPVFPYKGDLIVPLRQVAEALGIKVHQKGQTIALLPN